MLCWAIFRHPGAKMATNPAAATRPLFAGFASCRPLPVRPFAKAESSCLDKYCTRRELAHGFLRSFVRWSRFIGKPSVLLAYCFLKLQGSVQPSQHNKGRVSYPHFMLLLNTRKPKPDAQAAADTAALRQQLAIKEQAVSLMRVAILFSKSFHNLQRHRGTGTSCGTVLHCTADPARRNRAWLSSQSNG